MSKKNAQRFLEKTKTTPELAEKLRKLKETYTRQLIALAGEAAVPLDREGFTEATQPLSDEQAENGCGGYIHGITGLGYFK